MAEFGFFVGRMNPIHIGHEAVINRMIEMCGIEHSVIVIGSCNAPASIRHFFSYNERRNFIRQLYPTVRIVGLPDYLTDEEWLRALYDLMEAITGTSKPGQIKFFGGAEDEVQWYIDAGHQVEVLNRFDGTTPIVSATEVRDHLIQAKSLEGLINPELIDPIQELFKQRWDAFKQL